MQLIIVSDIFGRTEELESLVLEVAAPYSNTVILDPYNGKFNDFKNESEAYYFFQKNVGLNTYTDTVFQKINQLKEASILLGFSIGASVIWSVSDKHVFHQITKAICFYGSQIRNLLITNPKIETELIFPVKEDHFDVSNLILDISYKSKVKCTQTPYLHGFMNKRSVNYDETGFLEYVDIIKNLA